MEIITIDIGDCVICDICCEDRTDDNRSGGFLFGSKAVCPDCVQGVLSSARKYNEERFIRAHCPENMSFSNWVRTLR